MSMLADRIKTLLINQIGELAVENWFKTFEIKQYGANVTVLLPNKFIKDWVSTHYIDELHKALQITTNQANIYLCFELIDECAGPEEQVIRDDFENHTFSNFIVGKTNEIAYTAALEVAQNIRGAVFNPLFLYGEPGVGKSHLLSAIVNYVKKHNPDIKIYYMTAEKFMYTFIKALKDNSVLGFKEELRDADLLVVDDAQFLMGKGSTQEEFFHTFNFLKSKRCQIVLSSDKSPNQLDQLEKRLRSRLGGGLTIEMHQPDYELRLSILISKAQGLDIDIEVLQFLAERIQGNVRDLEGAWTRLVTHAQWMRQPISIELAATVLKDNLITQATNVLTQEKIREAVCSHFGTRVADIVSSKREKHISRSRHVVMFLMKELLNLSSSDIGRSLGGKDHTSVLYAIDKITKEQVTNATLLGDIKKIKQTLADK